jgi:tetratricopeptide (TPR) repeat protein
MLEAYGNRTALDMALYMSRPAFEHNLAESRLKVAAANASAAPGDALAQLRHGRALEDLGRYAEAENAFRAFAKLRPQEWKIWTGIGAMHRKGGDPEKAIAAFDAGLGAHPRTVSLAVQKADLLYRLDRYDDAARAFAAAAGYDERDGAKWRWWQALNVLLAGDFASASAHLKSAPADYQPLRTLLLRHASAVVAKSADADAARQALAAALDGIVKSGKQPDALQGEERVLAGVAAQILGAPQGWAAPKANSDEERCFRDVFAGLHRFADPKAGTVAKENFTAAMSACVSGGIEHKLASASLARLK